MRRVVVTGMGLVSPLGGSLDSSWERLIAGDSGAKPISKFDVSQLPCKIAAPIPRSDREPTIEGVPESAVFHPDNWVEPKDQRRMDDFIVYGIAAAQMAMDHSGLKLNSRETEERAGVMCGAGIGGLEGIEKYSIIQHEKGPRRVSPFFITGSLINLISGQISIRFGLRGPNHAVVTACSSSAHAIGDAARLIMLDDADVMVAGGAESAICPIGIGGFAACKALTTHFNDDPQKASRPYDKDRDGFLMGEGAGMLILEEYEHAKARGATIYAEITGYGLSGDAYHVTAPAEDGDGAFRSMRMALKRAGLAPSDIQYVNAHGTSTPLGDEIELRAVERLFEGAAGETIMSSTKSSIGHLLGAAGAAETIFCILAMRDNIAPATLNLDNPSVETTLNLAPNMPVKRDINAVLSNSFGFGGTNASLVLQQI